MYTDNAGFEWDDRKARRNSLKHGVGFKEATTVLLDPDALIADDLEHSSREPRQRVLGESASGRVLVVIFCSRPGPTMRIVSARAASWEERQGYEENRRISF